MAQQRGGPPAGRGGPPPGRGGGGFQDHTIPEGETELTLDVPEGQKIVCPRGQAQPKVALSVQGNRVVLDQPAPAGGVKLRAKVVDMDDDEGEEA